MAPWNNTVGQIYGDLLILLGQEETALEFYRNLSQKISPNTGQWVWIRLGLSERKSKNYEESVKCFQNALNCDSTNARVLECLGEAYLMKDSLLNAQTSFESVLLIEPDSIYSCYMIGCIKLKNAELDLAIDMFNMVLNRDNWYVKTYGIR